MTNKVETGVCGNFKFLAWKLQIPSVFGRCKDDGDGVDVGGIVGDDVGGVINGAEGRRKVQGRR